MPRAMGMRRSSVRVVDPAVLRNGHVVIDEMIFVCIAGMLEQRVAVMGLTVDSHQGLICRLFENLSL